MMTKTRLALAGIAAMLLPALAGAVPFASGHLELDSNNPFTTLTIDAYGYDNLALAFSAMGTGTWDPCGDFYIADCLAASIDDTEIFSGLTIARGVAEDHGPYGLPVGNASFDLTLDARITGADEALIIDWEIFGAAITDQRVLEVAEPGIFVLLTLGLAGFGFSRRR